MQAGLEFTLIRRRRRWRYLDRPGSWSLANMYGAFLQPITCWSNDHRHDYVALRKPKTDWADFQLYALPQSTKPTVYVIPCGSIKANTDVSLKNEKLAVYRNNWSLLNEPVTEKEIEWRAKAAPKQITWRVKVPKPPKPIPAAIQATMDAAASHGLNVERPRLESQYQVLISGKRCQIVQTKSVVSTVAGNVRNFVPLNLPRSNWAEFLIYFADLMKRLIGDF